MKNISRLALLLKFLQTWQCQSDCDHAKAYRGLSLRSSVIAMKQALKLNRLPFEWTTKIFLWFDIFSDGVEWKATSDQQPSFTALLSRAIFMYSWIWLSLFIHHTSWAVCFCDRTCVFLWTTIQSEFTEHFTFTLCIRDKKKHTHTHTQKKTSRKSVKLNLPN